MSVFLDRTYLLRISSRLRNFKQKKDDLYNFSCPICGDSQKNRTKARGYVFRKNNDYFYTCHNCQTGTTFSKILKHVDEQEYAQYCLDRYSSGDNNRSNYEKPLIDLKGGRKPTEAFQENITLENIFSKSVGNYVFGSLDTLPAEHFAVQYIRMRKIPEKFWKEIFYTNKFKDFLDNTFKDHGKDNVPNDDRIVLCYTNSKGEITNVAGRALGESKIRYITVKVLDEKKLFGLHRLRPTETVYVLEGQFDSYFVENSVASGDSNLCAVPDFLSDSECVLVYDAEPRNKEIVKQINRAIENDHSVVLFPNDIPYKDVNEMIMNGMSESEVMNIIRENTFQGLTAKLKFAEWRKC